MENRLTFLNKLLLQTLRLLKSKNTKKSLSFKQKCGGEEECCRSQVKKTEQKYEEELAGVKDYYEKKISTLIQESASDSDKTAISVLKG